MPALSPRPKGSPLLGSALGKTRQKKPGHHSEQKKAKKVSREEAEAKSRSERAKAKANLHVVRVRSDVFFRKDSSDAQRAQVEARVQAEPVASIDGSASFGGEVGYEPACVRCEPFITSPIPEKKRGGPYP